MSISTQTLPLNPQNILGHLESFKKIAEMFGLEGNQALLSANKATEKLTGLNPMKLLGISIPSKTQQQEYTVSDIARMFSEKLKKYITPVDVNNLLEKEGFQESYRDHKNRKKWRTLEKAKDYASYRDVLKRNSEGAPILQIKWHCNVVDYLTQNKSFE